MIFYAKTLLQRFLDLFYLVRFRYLCFFVFVVWMLLGSSNKFILRDIGLLRTSLIIKEIYFFNTLCLVILKPSTWLEFAISLGLVSEGTCRALNRGRSPQWSLTSPSADDFGLVYWQNDDKMCSELLARVLIRRPTKALPSSHCNCSHYVVKKLSWRAKGANEQTPPPLGRQTL